VQARLANWQQRDKMQIKGRLHLAETGKGVRWVTLEIQQMKDRVERQHLAEREMEKAWRREAPPPLHERVTKQLRLGARKVERKHRTESGVRQEAWHLLS